MKDDLFRISRWGLFLPIALIAGTGAGNIAELTCGLAKDLDFVGWVVNGWVTPAAGIWVGSKIAPRETPATTLLLCGVFVIEGGSYIVTGSRSSGYGNDLSIYLPHLVRGLMIIGVAVGLQMYAFRLRRNGVDKSQD